MSDFVEDESSYVARPSSRSRESRSIEWYAEGQSRVVEVGGIQVTIRFVGRKGRRGRIAVTAPEGATFRSLEERR